jgi:uncharacterized membrane protein
MDGVIMTPGVKVGIAGIVIALILLIVGVPFWAVVAVFLVALAIPVGGYLMLDKSQRRRAREVYNKRNRGIGR